MADCDVCISTLSSCHRGSVILQDKSVCDVMLATKLKTHAFVQSSHLLKLLGACFTPQHYFTLLHLGLHKLHAHLKQNTSLERQI